MATSTGRCANCGAELPPGAEFCSRCGTRVGGQPPAAPPPPMQPAAPPVQAPAQPPVVTVPPPRRSGAAVAGIVSVLVAAAAGAGVYFFTREPEPQRPTGGGGPVVPGPVATVDPTSSPPPGGGALDEFVQEQVGTWTLQDVTRDPEIIATGATDALTMAYTSADGVELIHTLWAEPSEADAGFVLETAVSKLTAESGYQVVEQASVTSTEGVQLGTVVVLQGADEVVIWTNGVLVASAEAPPGYATDFYNNIPY